MYFMRFFEKWFIPAGGVIILLTVLFAVVYFVFPHAPDQAPVVPVDDSGTPEEVLLGNIRIAEPTAGEVVGLPLVLTGQARVFENVFQYRVVDDAGVVLAGGRALANAFDAGEFGSFTLSVNYKTPTTLGGAVEVFSLSAKDGLEQDMVRIPVTFSKDIREQEVFVYFLPSDALATGTDCGVVARVTRRVPYTVALAHAAFDELLRGVDASEEGVISLIPAQARVRSINIEEGVATVTFVKDSFLGTAGSCMVTAIRAQIDATLRQFSSVASVIITEEGKAPEEILQP